MVLAPDAEAAAASLDRESWSIVIVVFRGPEHARLAQLGRDKIQMETSLDTVRIEPRGEEASAVVFGRYESPSDPEAQRDLSRIRAMRVDGQTPFAAAVLAPPPQNDRAATDPSDLRSAATRFGPEALYTLQVAAYGPEGGGTLTPSEREAIRRSAEAAARALRAEGETAFYYHGPNRSMVTVGVFGTRDHDPRGMRPESEALRSARERHPHHLVNGAARRISVRGNEGAMSTARLEPTFLVAVPR